MSVIQRARIPWIIVKGACMAKISLNLSSTNRWTWTQLSRTNLSKSELFIRPRQACLRGSSALIKRRGCLTSSPWQPIRTYFSSSSYQKHMWEDTPKMMPCPKSSSQASKTLILWVNNAQTSHKTSQPCPINWCLMRLSSPTTWISSSWSLRTATWWTLWIIPPSQGPLIPLLSIVPLVKTRHLPKNR